MNKATVLVISLSLFSVLTLAACGTEEPNESGNGPAANNTAPSRERTMERDFSKAPAPKNSANTEDPAKKIPKIVGQVQGEGYGLTLIVDGSSPEAFKESLALIASDTSENQYRTLDSALRYLQVYSSDGWAGLPGFYERLNGMTGEEIIERADRLKRERGR